MWWSVHNLATPGPPLLPSERSLNCNVYSWAATLCYDACRIKKTNVSRMSACCFMHSRTIAHVMIVVKYKAKAHSKILNICYPFRRSLCINVKRVCYHCYVTHGYYFCLNETHEKDIELLRKSMPSATIISIVAIDIIVQL